MITFGRYRILHRIASGGMAEVYRAIAVGEGGFEKEVVLKRIRPELAGDPRFGAMFVAEARVAATLSHANIVQVLDFGRVDGEYFLTLESVRGRDLRQVLDAVGGAGKLLPLGLALHVAVDVARAVDYAHRRKGSDGRPLGLVHRDISPHNVLLSFEGEVKLADFGIAKVVGDDPGRSEAGTIKGKVAYMSPEQAAGAPLDQRSDLFSFGLLMQVLFTGAHPFTGGGVQEVLERVKRAEIGPLRRGGEPLPAGIEAVVTRCLARVPEERFASASDVLRALEEILAGRPARASATDLAAFMKAHFPYEVPIPIVALDRVVEQELRLESTDDGLATFTAVAPAQATESAPASGLAPASTAAPASSSAPGSASGLAPASAAASASPVAPALVPGSESASAVASESAPALGSAPGSAPAAASAAAPGSHRGRMVSGVVAAVVLAVAAVAAWRLIPAPRESRPPLVTAPAPALPVASAPTTAPASVPTSQPARPTVTPAVRPKPPAQVKARPPAPVKPAGRGFARFRTEPAYAEVWIAGTRRCNTPCTLDLAAGAYQVRLVNPTLRREATRNLVVGPEHTRERPADVSVAGFR